MKSILTPSSLIVSKYTEHFAHADAVLVTSDSCAMLMSRHPSDNSLDGLFRIIAASLFRKSSECLTSVCTLCACGQIRDAKVIVRKQFESVVNLKYIQLDKEARVRRFWHHGTIPIYHFARHVQQDTSWSDELRDGFAKLLPALEVAYKSAASFYPRDGDVVTKAFRKNWDGKNLVDMAIECGMIKERVAYKVLNYSVHTSNDDLTTYFDFETQSFRTEEDTDALAILIYQSMDYHLSILEVCNSAYSLNQFATIKSLRAKLDSIPLPS